MRGLYFWLLDQADTLDGWAQHSLDGGWSTHQVEANRKMADDFRRKAAELRATWTKGQ